MNLKISGQQAGLFCVVGFSNLLVDVAVYYSTYHFLHFNYLAAQAVSYPCGAVNSYLLNRKLTFQEGGRIRFQEVIRFSILNVVSIFASICALFLTNHVLKLDLTTSKMAANGCALCLNFSGSKWWVFRGKTKARHIPDSPVAERFDIRVDPAIWTKTQASDDAR